MSDDDTPETAETTPAPCRAPADTPWESYACGGPYPWPRPAGSPLTPCLPSVEAACPRHRSTYCPARIVEATRWVAAVNAEAREQRHQRVVPGIHAKRLFAAASNELAQTVALAAVRAWLASERRALLLHSGPGAGKSFAACLALRRHAGLYLDGGDLTRVSAWAAEWAAWTAAPMLVLDDFDRGENREQLRERVDRLISARYDEGRGRMVLATNLDKRALVAWLTDRARSRLVEMGGESVLVDCSGPDLRRRRA